MTGPCPCIFLDDSFEIEYWLFLSKEPWDAIGSLTPHFALYAEAYGGGCSCFARFLLELLISDAKACSNYFLRDCCFVELAS